jgi:hypothetical protein
MVFSVRTERSSRLPLKLNYLHNAADVPFDKETTPLSPHDFAIATMSSSKRSPCVIGIDVGGTNTDGQSALENLPTENRCKERLTFGYSGCSSK